MYKSLLTMIAAVVVGLVALPPVVADELAYRLELTGVFSPKAKKKGEVRILTWYVNLKTNQSETRVTPNYRIGKNLEQREISSLMSVRVSDHRDIMVFMAVLQNNGDWEKVSFPDRKRIEGIQESVDLEMAQYVRYMAERKTLHWGSWQAVYARLDKTIKEAVGKALVALEPLDPKNVQLGTREHTVYAGIRDEFHVKLLTWLYPHFNRSKWESYDGKVYFEDVDCKVCRAMYSGKKPSYWLVGANELQICLESMDKREGVVLTPEYCQIFDKTSPGTELFVKGRWVRNVRWTHPGKDLQVDFVKTGPGGNGWPVWNEFRNGELAATYQQGRGEQGYTVLHDLKRDTYIQLWDDVCKVSAQPFDAEAKVVFNGGWQSRSGWSGGKDNLAVEFFAASWPGWWYGYENGKRVFALIEVDRLADRVVLFDDTRDVYVFLDAKTCRASSYPSYSAAPTLYSGTWKEPSRK